MHILLGAFSLFLFTGWKYSIKIPLAILLPVLRLIVRYEQNGNEIIQEKSLGVIVSKMWLSPFKIKNDLSTKHSYCPVYWF